MVEWNYQNDPNLKKWDKPTSTDTPVVGGLYRGPAVIPDRMGALMDQLEAETPRNPRYKSVSPVGKVLDKEVVPSLAMGDTQAAVEALEKLLDAKGPPPQTPDNIEKFRAKRLEEILTETQLAYEPQIQAQILRVLEKVKIGTSDHTLPPGISEADYRKRDEYKDVYKELPTVLDFINLIDKEHPEKKRYPKLDLCLKELKRDSSEFAGGSIQAISAGSIIDLTAQLKAKTISPEEYLVSLVQNRKGLPEALKAVDERDPAAPKLIDTLASIYKDDLKIDPSSKRFLDMKLALEKAANKDVGGAAVIAAELVLEAAPSNPGQPKEFATINDLVSGANAPKADLLMMTLLSSIDSQETLKQCEEVFKKYENTDKLARKDVIGLYFKENVNGHLGTEDVVKIIYSLTSVKDPNDQLQTLAILKRLSDQKVGQSSGDTREPVPSFEQRVLNGLEDNSLKGVKKLEDIVASAVSNSKIGEKPGDAALIKDAFNSPNKMDFAALIAALSVARMDNGTGAMTSEQLGSFLGASNIVGKMALDNARRIADAALKNYEPKNGDPKCESRSDMEAVLYDTKQFRSNLKIALGMTSDAFDRRYPSY